MLKPQFKNPTTEKISDFLWDIGIRVYPDKVPADTFLPGIRIIKGEIYVEEEKLLSPGDILHEAGHLAIFSQEIRNTLTDTVVVDEIAQGGEEMAAIAWSWAALKHLEIAPEIVFHPQGYKEDSENIIENFNQKRYIGVPILAHRGLCNPLNYSAENDENDFPKMLKWTID